MTVQRGAVVIVDWPFASGRGRKPRPALIVQNDRDNQRLHNTILEGGGSRFFFYP